MKEDLIEGFKKVVSELTTTSELIQHTSKWLMGWSVSNFTINQVRRENGDLNFSIRFKTLSKEITVGEYFELCDIVRNQIHTIRNIRIQNESVQGNINELNKILNK